MGTQNGLFSKSIPESTSLQILRNHILCFHCIKKISGFLTKQKMRLRTFDVVTCATDIKDRRPLESPSSRAPLANDVYYIKFALCCVTQFSERELHRSFCRNKLIRTSEGGDRLSAHTR